MTKDTAGVVSRAGSASFDVRVVRADCILPEQGRGMGDCGLAFWVSRAGQRYGEVALAAQSFVVRVSRGGDAATLAYLKRPVAPGIVLASAYPYGAVIGDRELFWDKLESVRAALKKSGVGRLEIALAGRHLEQMRGPGLSRRLDEGRVGLVRETRHVLDLSDLVRKDDVLDGYPSKLRWAVRKASKCGVSVRKGGGGDVALAQGLYERTMKEKGAPTYYDDARLSYIAGPLAEQGWGALFVAEQQGIAVGMAAAVDSGTTRHVVQIAVPRVYRGGRVSELLVHEMIKDALGSNVQTLDFMATTPGDEGVSAFKQKWGAQESPVCYLVIDTKPVVSRIIALGRKISRLRARSKS